MTAKTGVLVYDIQRFCTHDGPGVRTVIFLKGCPLRCPWCANPESLEIKPELYYVKSKCIQCGECSMFCPETCIKLVKNLLHIDREKCICCFACVQNCPTAALTVKGIRYPIDKVINMAMADKPFFDESGGGITLSGGEILMQANAASLLLEKAKEAGLHTAIETSGFAPEKTFARVLQYCDLLYMDIKLIDRKRHYAVLGQYNDRILSNVCYAAEKRINMVVRFPLIPGYTMDEENISGFIELIAPLKVPVELLGFHQLGKNKYVSIGKDYSLQHINALREDDIYPIAGRLREAGITVIDERSEVEDVPART